MDGTIADLYGVSNWLTDLETEKTRPYDIAEPLYHMETLTAILCKLQNQGWKIAITTWLAMNGTKEYNTAVTKSKKAWLKKVTKKRTQKNVFCAADWLISCMLKEYGNWQALSVKMFWMIKNMKTRT